jgi:hypothetical protein
LNGEKTVEVRTYQPPHPSSFFNSPVLLIATTGPDGQASLGDVVHAGDSTGKVVGEVYFDKCVRYQSRREFAQDKAKHLVAVVDPSDNNNGKNKGNPYGWRSDVEIYGWLVKGYERYDVAKKVPEMKRELRSVYRVVEGGAVTEIVDRGC